MNIYYDKEKKLKVRVMGSIMHIMVDKATFKGFYSGEKDLFYLPYTTQIRQMLSSATRKSGFKRIRKIHMMLHHSYLDNRLIKANCDMLGIGIANPVLNNDVEEMVYMIRCGKRKLTMRTRSFK
jgi:hypothetical protein